MCRSFFFTEMLFKKTIILYFLVVFNNKGFCLSSNDHHSLYNYLFHDYRKEIRPVNYLNQKPTEVSVQLFIKQIHKIVEKNQEVTLYCWLEMYWEDYNLVWNPEYFNGTSEIVVPVDIVWRPDLLVYNNAKMNVDETEIETNAVVKNDGSISVYRAFITKVTCSFSMEKFPFDEQVCFIMLASWSYDGSGIMLHTVVPSETDNEGFNTNNISVLQHYIPNGEWEIKDLKIRRNLKKYECCETPYPDVTYYFIIKRNPIFYLFSQLIPCLFICIVTIIGSFTRYSTTGEQTEKISLNSTALLSLAIILMMVGDKDKLPASSSLPLLGKFYIGLICTIFGATCGSRFILNIQMRGNCEEPIPHWLTVLFMKYKFLRKFFDFAVSDLKRNISFNSSSAEIQNLMRIRSIHQKANIYEELRAHCKAADNYINARHHSRSTHRQWELIACGLDRIFMTTFTLFTVFFFIWLFFTNVNSTTTITNDIMDNLTPTEE